MASIRVAGESSCPKAAARSRGVRCGHARKCERSVAARTSESSTACINARENSALGAETVHRELARSLGDWPHRLAAVLPSTLRLGAQLVFVPSISIPDLMIAALIV